MIEKQLEEAIIALDDKEKQSYIDYIGALEIESLEKATKAMSEAHMRIRSLRSWKSRLKALATEVAASSIDSLAGMPAPSQALGARPSAPPPGAAPSPAPSLSANPAPSLSANPAPSLSANPAPSLSANPAPSLSANPAPSLSPSPVLSPSPSPAKAAPVLRPASAMPAQDPPEAQTANILEASPILQTLPEQEIILQPVMPAEQEPSFGEGASIRQIVWDKLEKLCGSGHRFTFAELLDMQSKRWSKSCFGIETPFARVFRPSIDTASQVEDEFGNEAYYLEPLEFGGNKLLFASVWDESNISQFNEWLALTDGDDDDNAIAAAKPESVKAVFFGKEMLFKDKQEAFAKLCETLLLRKPYEVAAFDESEALSEYFSYDPVKAGESPISLRNGLFVRSGLSDSQIGSLVSGMLKACSVSESEVAIEGV